MSASESILLRLTPDELAAIDRVRGSVKRGPWIKALCADAVLAHDLTSGYRQGPAESVSELPGSGYVSPFVGPGAKSSNLEDVL